jgi:hypothetical protein
MPNDNYCKFEEWIFPVLDEMVEEQKKTVRRARGTQCAKWLIDAPGRGVDAVQNDCPFWQGYQQPRLCVLLGLEGRCCHCGVPRSMRS